MSPKPTRQRELSATADGGSFADLTGVVHSDSEGGIKGVSEQLPGGKDHAATDEGGSVTQSVSGLPPIGSEGELGACEQLARAWSHSEVSWRAEPEPDKNHIVDCRLHSNNSEIVEVQVTRFVPSAYWKHLRDTLATTDTVDNQDIVEQMHAAVTAKGDKYGEEACEDLVLLLDAAQAPRTVMRGVIKAARASGYFRDTGFAEIWVIASLDGTAIRLDQ